MAHLRQFNFVTTDFKNTLTYRVSVTTKFQFLFFPIINLIKPRLGNARYTRASASLACAFVSWTGVDSDSLNNLGSFLILLEPKAGSHLHESKAEIRAAEIEKEEQRNIYHP